jgi:hypothetical protein
MSARTLTDHADGEWGHGLAKSFIELSAKNPYQFGRAFYNQHIHLVPISILRELDHWPAVEEPMQPMWNNTSAHISKLLSLKAQTIQLFNE